MSTEKPDGISAKLRKYADAAAASGNYPPAVLLESCSNCGAGPGDFCLSSQTVRGRRRVAQTPCGERIRLSNLGRS